MDEAQQIAALLRRTRTPLDDALIAELRAALAEPEPEPIGGATPEQGGVTIGKQWTTIREQV